ncbi:hypothetical protein U9M48_042510, partial [Paspalum notatum var. saurae]
MGAKYLSSNPVFHARTKHIEVDYHFVRERFPASHLPRPRPADPAPRSPAPFSRAPSPALPPPPPPHAHDARPSYRSVVGALQYLTLTRPNIAFPINKACQFLHAPTTVHWAAVKRILRYIKSCTNLGLKICKSSSMLVNGYSNADWAGCLDDKRSIGGFAIFLRIILFHGMPRNKRRYLGQALRLIKSPPAAKLWVDSMGAKYLSSNPVFHDRTKHIEVDYHFVRERVARKLLEIGLFLLVIKSWMASRRLL